MRSYSCFLFISLFAATLCGSFINTTAFWQSKLGKPMSQEAYAGFIPFIVGFQQIDWYYSKASTGMFYSAFSAVGASMRKSNPNTPVIIWLQGGPGSSSQFGAFTEIGPVFVNNNKVTVNPYSWNFFGHLLFIDSPLNVGFSYDGNDRSGKQIINSTDTTANHLVNFLFNFYKTWPELLVSPLYIGGESYAGHYIPGLTAKLLNNASLTGKIGKVAGIIVGDGWTDPINQLNYYDTYLYSAGIIDGGVRDNFTQIQANSILSITAGDYNKATEYISIITDNDDTASLYFSNCSLYNFRNYFDPDVSFGTFLEENKAQMGVPGNIKYIGSNGQTFSAFKADITLSFSKDIVNVLNQVRVLVYNGQYDVVVNTPGVLQYLNGLNWAGINTWKNTKKQIWTENGQMTGWTKVSANLWFILVNFAGHMIPSDQPKAAFSMIGHFLKNDNNWKN